jgi:CheY-like chemotaxis protein
MGATKVRLVIVGNEAAASALCQAASRVPGLIVVEESASSEHAVIVLDRDALARRQRSAGPSILFDPDLRPEEVATQLDCVDALLTSAEPAALLASVHTALVRGRERAAIRSLESAAFSAARSGTVQELSRGVIHDLNNVFCVVQSFSELLLESTPSSDPRLRDIQEIANASQRAAVLVDRLVGFSRSSLHRSENFNVSDQQRRLEPLLRRLLGERYELLLVTSSPNLAAVFDPFVFTQTVLDVAARLKDLCDAGLLTVEARPEVDVEPSSDVVTTISLTPSGGGRSGQARLRDSIPAAPEFIAARGGRLSEIDPLTFQLVMPRASASASTTEVIGGSETILVVEDEQAVRLALARALRSLGYTVYEARLGADARVVAATHPIDLVIADVVLPDGDGLDLLAELASTFGGARRVGTDPSPTRALVVTGYADRDLHRLDPRVPLLRKPFSVSDLARKVRAALAD